MRKIILLALIILSWVVPVQSQITVVTYNIRYANSHDSLNSWENRGKDLCGQLKNYQGDFIGLQEALFSQIKLVKIELGKTYSYIGVGRDFGDSQGEHCALFYNTDKYDLLDLDSTKTFWLSKTPSIPSKAWDAALPRIATGSLFRNRKTKEVVYVINTHFDHVGENARIQSMYLIYNRIKPYLDKNIPVVLMGDFNLPSDAVPIQWISEKLKDSRISKVSISKHENEKFTFNGFKENFKGPIIDYVFTNSALDVVDYHVDHSLRGKNLFYSDHFPVIVRLENKGF